MTDNLEWLNNDIKHNREFLYRQDSQIARRNYLRSLTALYELTMSNLRERTMKLQIEKFEFYGEWMLHELSPLLDEMSTLSDNGRLRLIPNRQPFLSLVAYTLKTYANIIGYPKDVLSDHHWKAFCQTIKIRNRITHPKFHSDIDISDDELLTIDEGKEWWDFILRELWETHWKREVEGTLFKYDGEKSANST